MWEFSLRDSTSSYLNESLIFADSAVTTLLYLGWRLEWIVWCSELFLFIFVILLKKHFNFVTARLSLLPCIASGIQLRDLKNSINALNQPARLFF